MLNELTAKITQKEVFVGPIEATVLGNSIVQMLANEDISTLNEGQELIYKHHVQIESALYHVQDEKAYIRFFKN